MRIISYIVSFIALVLFLNIILSFVFPSYKSYLKSFSETHSVVNKWIKSGEKIKKISKIGVIKKDNIAEIIGNSLSVKIDELEKIPQSIKSKIQKLNLKKIEKTQIFGIKKLDKNIDFTEYFDNNNKISVYVFESDYGTMMNLFRIDPTYSVNEANNFFWYWFYLNTKKNDKIRFVIQIEGKSMGFEATKDKYEFLKNILLK